MTRLALLRHFPTAWNESGRMQGRADVPLSESSHAALAGLAVPAEFAHFAAMCSPLKRTRQTALALGLAPTGHARWIEMDWGGYEGRTLAALRALPDFAANEALGLDFQPPGGESPRTVFARVLPLLAEIAARARDTLAVTHRGVIRAIHAHASGWDMKGKPPVRLEARAVHLFRLAPDGTPSIERLNIPLVPAAPAREVAR